jgi:hypothetical protein
MIKDKFDRFDCVYLQSAMIPYIYRDGRSCRIRSRNSYKVVVSKYNS